MLFMEGQEKPMKEVVLAYRDGALDYMKLILEKRGYRVNSFGSCAAAAIGRDYKVVIDNMVVLSRLDGKEIDDRSMGHLTRLAGDLYGIRVHEGTDNKDPIGMNSGSLMGREDDIFLLYGLSFSVFGCLRSIPGKFEP